MVKRAAKKTAKKRAVKKTVWKPAVKKAARRPMPRSSTTHKLSEGGVLVPASMAVGISESVVSASKLTKGLASAKKQITNLIQEIVDTAIEDYEISEIELAASFNAEGKFMGIGVGGEATIVIRIRPCE